MSKRIIFMGTPDYAAAILDELISAEDVEIIGVFTQPDKKVGRKQQIKMSEVKQSALKASLEVYQPNRLRDEQNVKILQELKPDMMIVAAYGQILPKSILDIVPCINLHASLLPEYRGASPIQQMLLNSDTNGGVTAMLMDEGLDTGDILALSVLKIDKTVMLSALYEKLTKMASILTLSVIRNFETLNPVPQLGCDASHCAKITKEQGLTKLEDALETYNHYRAYTPWPGIFLENGIKLLELSLNSKAGSFKSSEILEIRDEDVVIGCKVGSIALKTLQPPSKKSMDIHSYLNGKHLSVGNTLL